MIEKLTIFDGHSNNRRHEMHTAAIKKKISVVVPCYNEEKTVNEVYDRLIRVFDNELSAYDFEIIYVDDYSSDDTRIKIEALCRKDQRVKAVFNARNFGFHRNVFQSYQYAAGGTEGNGVCRYRRTGIYACLREEPADR